METMFMQNFGGTNKEYFGIFESSLCGSDFCEDSFSQINCFGRCSNVSLIIGSTGLWLIVLI